MRRLRVLSVFGTLQIGGDENRCAALARHAQEHIDHRVLLLAEPAPDERARGGDMLRQYADLGIPVDTLALPARGRLPRIARQVTSPSLLAWSAFRLRRWLQRNPVDIVDARLTTGMAVAALACAALPVVLVGTDYFPDWWEQGEGRVARRWTFPRLDAFITDSHFMGRAFSRYLGDRVHVIHNGIPRPQTPLSRAQARERLGLPVDALVMTQIARLVPYKGQLDTLEASAEVLMVQPQAHLLLCGFDAQAPGFAQELRDRAKALGLHKRVTVMGYHGPAADVWAATDLHLHPSYRDSSPISIHEAMSCGIPSILSDVAGLPELVEDGVSGVLIKTGDRAGLAHHAGLLLANPKERARLGAGARARWEKKHRPEHLVAQTVELFQQLVRAQEGSAHG